jgi:N utilization substance protein A
LREEAATLEIQDDLLDFHELDLETVVALGRKGVKSLDDFADLAADELVELLPDSNLTEEAAGELIMAARAHWFGDEEAEPANEAETGEDPAPEAGPGAPAEDDGAKA